MIRWQVALLCAGLACFGCAGDGEDDGGLVDHGRSFFGTTTLLYSFLNETTFDRYTPPPPSSGTALVTPSADLLVLTIETPNCTTVAEYSSTAMDGRQIYGIDETQTTCQLVVNREPVVFSDYRGSVTWGPSGLSVGIGAVGEISDSDSLVSIDFE